MIGATRATWGHVFRMTHIPRTREAHNGVLVAPRGPKVSKTGKNSHSPWLVGATSGPRARPFFSMGGWHDETEVRQKGAMITKTEVN